MSRRFYRALLWLYPKSFRVEYGAELAHTFEESTRGRSRLAAHLAAIGDVVPNAMLAHGTVLRQDLRYAVRAMSRSRGFVTAVVLVTALGVGANTATFSVADAVLLRPLPFPQPDALVRLCEGPRDGSGWGCMNELSPANFRDVVAMARKTRGWGAFTGAEANLVGGGEPVRLSATAVTPEVLPVLGVRPLLGRVFDAKDATDPRAGTVVLSYGLWQSQFGGNPDVVGTTIRLDDVPRVVIGVMPRSFHFPTTNDQLWTPLVLREEDYAERDNTYLQAIGRLAPGVTFESARGELAMIAARLARDHPETNEDVGFSFFRQRDQVLPRYRVMLLALCGASLSLLLLTGANLANLLLVRASARERELAVRAALGAGRERLVRQMLTESVVLALLGGAVGLLVAMLAVPLLTHLVPTSLPLAHEPRLDPRALLIAGAFTALTGIGFGLLPATMVGGRAAFSALRDGARAGGGRRQRLRAVLVAVEVAVSVVLLVSSGLLIRAVWKVRAVDPGFTTEQVLTMRTALPSPRAADTLRRTEFYDRVLAGVQSLPGVQAAAYTSGLPFVLWGGIGAAEIPGEDERNRRADGESLRWITPQFFTALGVPVLRGRAIADGDRFGRPLVAVVSEAFVRRHWPNGEPLGKRFRLRGMDYTVVGVVRDIRVRGLERSSEPQLYFAAAQAGQLGGLYVPKDLIVRANGRSETLLPAIRRVIRGVDPEQPISDVRQLSEVVSNQTADRRAQLGVLTALAVVALLLTGIGIYGLLAFIVAQRAREIGVRLALGADPRRAARMIVFEAVRLALLGGIPGVLVAYAAARAMRALLFGVPPSDPLALAAGVGVVLVATLIGSLAPALSAVRVSPLLAMRAD
ncbi:permease [Gemmatirosa kalamazoonensis]|uniref:Permease n=1 Tax=Gemmatirosa kalamazoonensis TaxID=861299 RepID=W0RMF7_9BACT|nr:ABC transporter permease [Gemmatirosa kalamazoonensis]AHG91652.1 permease [Gemmatirosa kalamazoonensis]